LRNIAKHIHFVGIGGIGMSGLARILLGFNVKVSGSDVMESKMVKELMECGAEIYIGHRAENLSDDVDMLVYSSVIKENNPEYIEAERRGIKIIPRAQLLAIMMEQCTGIAVAGAHGKTSTTGMLGTVFRECGKEPSIIIGGYLPNIKANACWGKGEYLIAEADESDGSFLLLPPKYVVVTNIENDHLDYYGTMENLIGCFDKFIHQIPADGKAFLNIDSEIVSDIVKTGRRDYITYGIDNKFADYRAVNIEFDSQGTVSEIYHKGEYLGKMRLYVPGVYNVSNALATFAVAHTLGMEPQEIFGGLEEFHSTGRRFEFLAANKAKDIVLYDDYAHHPTEIKSVIGAAKKLGYKRVVAVFQPHRYSRTRILKDQFAACFDEADVLVLNEIYSAFETPILGVDANMLIDAIKKRGREVVYYGKEADDVMKILDEVSQSGDLILIMGAGNIRRKIGDPYAEILAAK
jgi:UDP-N-acetylmuramate--alanine ligase